ncbi:MAG TPA: hypothetical protein ENH12_02200 [Proteobacteria bacterium]|nr:hypothetical protein [Pseudomonadota bacterium]
MTENSRKFDGNPDRSWLHPHNPKKPGKVSRGEDEELRQIERRYRALLNDRNEFICSTLPDLTITTVNDAHEDDRGIEMPCAEVFAHSRNPIEVITGILKDEGVELYRSYLPGD